MPRQFNDPDYPDTPTTPVPLEGLTDAEVDELAQGWQPAIKNRETGKAEGIRSLPADSETRKFIPLTTGCIDYFPLALAYVAKISFHGNQKHNPGEPLHWSRGKSNDHADCCGRHLVERGTRDPSNNLFHDGMLAWRSLANLQLFLENEIKQGRDPWK